MILVRSVREKGTKMAAFRGKLVRYICNGGGRVIYPPEEFAFLRQVFFQPPNSDRPCIIRLGAYRVGWNLARVQL